MKYSWQKDILKIELEPDFKNLYSNYQFTGQRNRLNYTIEMKSVE